LFVAVAAVVVVVAAAAAAAADCYRATNSPSWIAQLSSTGGQRSLLLTRAPNLQPFNINTIPPILIQSALSLYLLLT